MHIWPDDIMEEIHEIWIFDTDNIDTKNAISEIKDNSKELLEKYKVFWNPDEKQRKMIDSWDVEFKNKMFWILTFLDNEIILKINDNKKLFFPKNTIKFRENNNLEKKLLEKWMRLINMEETDYIHKIFSYNIMKFIEILNIPKKIGYSEIRYIFNSNIKKNSYTVNEDMYNSTPNSNLTEFIDDYYFVIAVNT